ncbi:glycosyltransferase [Curtobacterium sp. SGAir0471]|uniref:glycosyltransferase n=1 Tax=Curtobacterium sp. SGAir0471 TaxID=2070337 RepID=UPI001586D081|nr:glycosyltransferase [Curtobacterium sp. SGAir0471]
MQMLEAISGARRVLYVARGNPRPLRTRRFRDFLSSNKRESFARPGLHLVNARLAVLNLPTWSDWIPLVAPEVVRRIQLMMIRMLLQRAVKRLNFREPKLVTYWWMFPEIVRMACWRYRTFDVIDRHWGYEYLGHRLRQANWRLAVATAQVSDRIVAVSEGLASELQPHIKTSVEVLPNGVDIDRVRRVLRNAVARTQVSERRKTAAYVGGWNSRIDLLLVTRVVRSLPDWSFLIIGVDEVPELAGMPNVRIVGDLAYDEVINELSTARVGLVPFHVDAYTKASSFLKVFDYLAAGMSVLSTRLPTVEAIAARFPQYIRVESGANWVEQLQEMGATEELAPIDLALLPSIDQRAQALLAPPMD